MVQGSSWASSFCMVVHAAFYIVVKGRKCGVFYKWEDCLASVANFDQAVFFGVDR